MCVYMGAPIDLTGKRFGRLVVVSESSPHYSKGGSKQRQWNCLCDCGKEIITTTQNLRKGDTKSCECLKIEMNINNATTHGDSKSKLYSVWKAMRKRCKNTHNSDYKYYGGKGIKVCNEWDTDFESFKSWSLCNGYNPELTIDRIDLNKDYCPDNCRWVDFKTQCNNRSTNTRYTYDGETHTIAEWSEITGINYSTLYHRIKQGKTINEVLTNYNSNNKN